MKGRTVIQGLRMSFSGARKSVIPSGKKDLRLGVKVRRSPWAPKKTPKPAIQALKKGRGKIRAAPAFR